MNITSKKKKWNSTKLVLFFERVSLYVDSRMPIDEAVKECADIGSKGDEKIVHNIAMRISSGLTFSRVCDERLILPRSVVGIISAGEESGRLGSALLDAKSMLERLESLKKKIISASIYPCIIGAFSFLLIIGLVRGVLPEISPILKGLSMELPIMTRALMAASDAITEYGIIMLSTIITVSVAALYSFKKIKVFTRLVHAALMRIPLVGDIAILSCISIWGRTFGSMISARVPLDAAYTYSAESLFLIPLRESIMLAEKEIQNGKSVSRSLEYSCTRVPSFMASLIKSGEKTGNLGPALVRSSDIIDADLDHSLKRLTALIEPALMISIGVIVGAIALSIIMPIYDISKTLQNP